MKAKELMALRTEEECTGDYCELCLLHEIAARELPDNYLCPHCGNPVWWDEAEDTIVGETNDVLFDDNGVCIDEQKVIKCLTVQCATCGEYVALIPELIHYNGNHDIYYTGGRDYVLYGNPVPLADLLPTIEQFFRRRDAGEKGLTPELLAGWLAGDIERAVASYLYHRGLKK